MSTLEREYTFGGGQLSKYDLKREQESKKGLKIFPFDNHCTKAASYDLTPTIIAMSSKVGMLETVYREKLPIEDRYYIYVRPKDTVLIVSNEYLIVPSNIAGYVSSRVSKVVEGFGHISTTIDPNWSGAALIAVSNPSTQMLKIYVGKNADQRGIPNQLATVTFHYLHNPCKKKDKEQKQEGMRLDLLRNINYTGKKGVYSFFRNLFLRRRREFTDYFFAASKVLEQGFTEEHWTLFLKDFSNLTAEPRSEDAIVSQKAQKLARDFIITENVFLRMFHWLGKHKAARILLLITVLVVLWRTGILSEEMFIKAAELISGR